jgi:RNA polymerase sigma-70 factor (ECF subfamily)
MNNVEQITASESPSQAERAVLAKYIAAHEQGNADAVVELLGTGVRLSMTDTQDLYAGHEAVAAFFRDALGHGAPGRFRLLPVSANGRPAAANYVQGPADPDAWPMALDVLQIVDGKLVNITVFDTSSFAVLGLPRVL